MILIIFHDSLSRLWVNHLRIIEEQISGSTIIKSLATDTTKGILEAVNREVITLKSHLIFLSAPVPHSHGSLFLWLHHFHLNNGHQK